MTYQKLQQAEQAARTKAHNCPVYAPGETETDARYKAIISGQRSAQLGDEWLRARTALVSHPDYPHPASN